MIKHGDQSKELLDDQWTGQKSRQTNHRAHENAVVLPKIKSHVCVSNESESNSRQGHSVEECYMEFLVFALSVDVLYDVVANVAE